MTGRSISAVLADEVVRRHAHTYGLMGNGNAFFLDALVRSGGAFTAVRHEAAAVAAADTAWRVSRRAAVATVTFGAGFTNTLTALAEAAMHRTPLVLITGDQPTSGPRPWDVDQRAMTEAAGALFVPVSLAGASREVAGAFDRALNERRPIVLALPYDLATVPERGASPAGTAGAEGIGDSPSPVASLPARRHDDLTATDSATTDLAAIVTLLEAAERPVIVAGDGAREAHSELVALAERLDALTATTAIAKGTFAGRDSDLGVCGGFATPDGAALIAEADVVLVMGAGLNQFTTAFGHAFGVDATIIQVDSRPEATNPRVDRFIHGECLPVATQLLQLLTGNDHPEWLGRGHAARPHESGAEFATDGQLDPRALFVELDRMLPAQRTVVQDGGHFSGWAPMYWTLPAPGRFHMVGTAFQSIGLGLAAALGSVTANPDDLTVLVAGDGGFLMSLADLDSVTRAASHCLIVIVNDAGYGAEVHQYGSRGIEEGPMRIGEVNFAALARGVGAEGVTVSSLADLAPLGEWVTSGCQGTFLLDARVSPQVVAPYMNEIVAVAAAAEAANRERFATA